MLESLDNLSWPALVLLFVGAWVALDVLVVVVVAIRSRHRPVPLAPYIEDLGLDLEGVFVVPREWSDAVRRATHDEAGGVQ